MKTKGVRVADLLQLVTKHYEINKLRTKTTVDAYIKNQLMPKMGEKIANHVRKSHVEDYKLKRKAEGASDCTVNRELQVLSKAFSLGLEDEIIERKPPIKLYPEPEPREGHYEPEEYAKWQDACRQLTNGEVIADIIMFAYHSGWRRGECLNLHRDWIRLRDKLAVLPKQFSKNKRIRVYPLEGKVLAMIEKRLANCNHEGLLFHRNGKAVKDMTAICKKVCDIIGVDSKHFFHNLRRSATTNLNRAGVDKETGKKITGHRTDSIYNNYNQVTLDAVRLAVKRAEEYVEMTAGEKQNGGATGNYQEVQEVTEREVTEVTEITSETRLRRYQEGDPKPAESLGFLARLWRFITKTGEKTDG
jgi:integrase